MSKVKKVTNQGDHLKLKTKFYPTQYIRFEEATIETDKTSKQGLYEVIQNFKEQVREEGKAFVSFNACY